MNPLTSINGKARVVSPDAFKARYPSGKVPRSSKECGKIFVCRRGCNTRTATYTEEFVWGDVYKSAGDILSLIDRVQSQTKATRKRRRDADYLDDEALANPKDNDVGPRTPKKRKTAQPAVTPSRSKDRTPQKFRTPQSKRLIIKKPLLFTPLSTRFLSPLHTTSSPFQLARTTLHVSSVPASLPCRQAEFSTIYSHLEGAITSGTGSCIYVSGVPGTGKTATVREVVQQLHASVEQEELDDFIFVEINGMKVTEPQQAYSLLWEALRDQRVSPSHASDLLEREFASPNPRRVPCVVLMDELDQLVTKDQSVMYNFFNWPNLPHSRLIVVAVANTMDLPERTLSNKISSRLGLTRVTFAGYTHAQLQEIVTSRLESVPAKIMDPDAIQFAARKVAAVSGDARRTLDICRRAVEIAEAELLKAKAAVDDAADDGDDNEPLLATPTKSDNNKKRRAGRSKLIPSSPPSPLPGTPSANQSSFSSSTKDKITISTIKAAIQEFTSSPLQTYLKTLPLSCKIFLAALLARVRRSGTPEARIMDVLAEAKRLGVMATDVGASAGIDALLYHHQHHHPSEKGSEGEGTARKADSQKAQKKAVVVKKVLVPRILGMGVAARELADAGVIGLEAGMKGERCGKVRLRVGEEEVKLALRDDAEVGGMGFRS